MPISNLAKVFGPTIVGYSKQEPDHATILGETIIQQNVSNHFLRIFTNYLCVAYFVSVSKQIS